MKINNGIIIQAEEKGMLETITKRGGKSCFRRAILGIVFLLLCLLISRFAIFAYIKGPIPLSSDMTYEELSGKYVTCDVEFNLGEYIREVSRNTNTGTETLTKVGYLIYNYDADSFIGMEMGASKQMEMDQMIEQSWAFLMMETDEVPEIYPVRGTLRKIPGSELYYFNDAVKAVFSETGQERVYPYVIQANHVNGVEEPFMWLTFIGAVAGLLYAIYSIVRILAGNFDKNIRKYISSNPAVSIEMLEADFSGARQIGKKVWVGRRWTFDLNALDARLYENESIVWAYHYKTVQGNTTTRSALRIYDRKKKMYMIPVPEKLVSIILSNYQANQPHMVIGYHKDLDTMFRNDFEGFLSLKYDTAERESLGRY